MDRLDGKDSWGMEGTHHSIMRFGRHSDGSVEYYQDLAGKVSDNFIVEHWGD